MSYELLETSWKLKKHKMNFKRVSSNPDFWVLIHLLRVQIRKMRVRIQELRVQIHELRVQIHKFKFIKLIEFIKLIKFTIYFHLLWPYLSLWLIWTYLKKHTEYEFKPTILSFYCILSFWFQSFNWNDTYRSRKWILHNEPRDFIEKLSSVGFSV